jgi:hypothetical protein
MNTQIRASLLAAMILGATLAVTAVHAQPYGYGPGMWQQMTPEQRQLMWERMHWWGGWGGGPGMMMGPGMGQLMTPQQYQQWWEQMRRRGYGPGMMYPMTPEQRHQLCEHMFGPECGPCGTQSPPPAEVPAASAAPATDSESTAK